MLSDKNKALIYAMPKHRSYPFKGTLASTI